MNSQAHSKELQTPMEDKTKNSRDLLTLSLPHLTDDERKALADYIQRPQVAEALAELTSACDCIGGSIFCTCEASGSLTAEQEQLLAPLVVAYGKSVELSAPYK